MRRLIGFTGYAGVGKDAAAAFLVDRGWQRVAFADPIRKMLLAMDPLVPPPAGDDSTYPVMAPHRRLSALIQVHGWDYVKRTFPEVRRLLQALGTEAGRDILGSNIWVETAMRAATADRVVFTDVRFPNECEAIRAAGGFIVRIERPGTGPANGHTSEMQMLLHDGVVFNDGTADELRAKVLAVTGDLTPIVC